MNDFSLFKYSPQNNNAKLMSQLVACYREVFAAAPWSEWVKCPCCNQQWGIESKEMLASKNFIHCGEKLVDFWPKEQVAADLRQEITEDASCWLALDNEKVVGFCWAYSIKLGDLEDKLSLKIPKLRAASPKQDVLYIDEIGVMREYRGKKLAKTLVSTCEQELLPRGLSFNLARVKMRPDPSISYLWFTQKLSYDVVASYPTRDGRVIVGRQCPSPC